MELSRLKKSKCKFHQNYFPDLKGSNFDEIFKEIFFTPTLKGEKFL